MKKSYIYILIFIFGLFSFSSDVWAAQELTCLYEKGTLTNKVLLIQYSNGKRNIYLNKKNVGVGDTGWSLYEGNVFKLNENKSDVLELDNSGNLKECPDLVNYNIVNGKDNIGFRNYNEDYNWFDKLTSYAGHHKLEESYEETKEPAVTTVGEVENTDLDVVVNKSCTELENLGWDNYWPDKLGDKVKSGYDGACLYAGDITIERQKACHLIQVSFNKNNVDVIEFDPEKGSEYSNKDYFSFENRNGREITGSFFADKNNITGKSILDSTSGVGSCIPGIMVDRNYKVNPGNNSIDTKVYLSNKKGMMYGNVDAKGKTSGTGKKLTVADSLDITFVANDNITSCEDLFGEYIVKGFKTCWNILKILVPIILLGLGTLDFAKAVFASEDNMKKAQSKFIKRIIIAVAIFVIPSILSLLLNLGNDIFGIFGENGTDICGLFG